MPRELADLSKSYNAVLTGWKNYYRRFHASAMAPCESVSHAMVEAQTQAVCSPDQKGYKSPGASGESKAGSICALESRIYPERLDNGSRMS